VSYNPACDDYYEDDPCPWYRYRYLPESPGTAYCAKRGELIGPVDCRECCGEEYGEAS